MEDARREGFPCRQVRPYGEAHTVARYSHLTSVSHLQSHQVGLTAEIGLPILKWKTENKPPF